MDSRIKNPLATKTLLAASAALAGLVALPTSAFGQSGFQSIPSVATWDGQIEFGGSVSTGNTKSENLFFGGQLNREVGPWKQSVFGSYDYGKSNKTVDSNGNALTSPVMVVARDRGLVGTKFGYTFAPRWYGFGLLQAERDRIANISRRTTEVLGLGYRAIDQRNMRLDLEAGPALQQTRYSSGSTNANTDETGAFFAARYKWDVNSFVKLTNDLSGTWTDANTSINNEMGLNVALTPSIGARFSHALTHNTDPATVNGNLLEKTDTTTRASLTFGF